MPKREMNKISCPECGSVFEANESAKLTDWIDATGAVTTVFRCPFCGTNVFTAADPSGTITICTAPPGVVPIPNPTASAPLATGSAIAGTDAMARAEMTNPGGLPDSGRIVVLWDPEIVEEDDYANLVAALGDLVRSKGGLGVERIGSQGITVPAAAEVLQ